MSGDGASLCTLPAADLAAAIRDGRVTAEETVGAYLAWIESAEPRVHAWAHLDGDHALDQARRADAWRATGAPLGPLHGVPVGVKDVIDTGDMPTECGSALCAGRTPRHDATVVARLRQAGAIVLGKTVTAEFAYLAPAKTCNPHDPARSPGGSSSGSAAAVAAAMVPLALGTQTGGSIIQPAAYCGVWGYKPSHGLISRHGVLGLSRRLDHVGVFARTVADLALFAEPLIGHDPEDPDTRPRATPRLGAVAAEPPPVAPKLAFVKSPSWPAAEDETRAAFAELVEALGDHVDEVALPPLFDEAMACHRLIAEADIALSLDGHYRRSADRLSPVLREAIERGLGHGAVDYNRAVARIEVLNGELDELFAGYDAVLTPSAPGVAPPREAGPQRAAFCAVWTLCGVPAVNLPLLQGESGLPIGVQLVGARGDDARLLRTANWLASLAEDSEDSADG